MSPTRSTSSITHKFSNPAPAQITLSNIYRPPTRSVCRFHKGLLSPTMASVQLTRLHQSSHRSFSPIPLYGCSLSSLLLYTDPGFLGGIVNRIATSSQYRKVPFHEYVHTLSSRPLRTLLTYSKQTRSYVPFSFWYNLARIFLFRNCMVEH
jgi:hypothetical protein